MQKQSAAVTSMPQPSARRVLFWRNTLTAWLFLVPTFILLFLFSYYPAVSALYHSLTNWTGLYPAEDFLLLENFQELISDRTVRASMNNMAIVMVWSLFSSVIPALLVAVMIDSLRSDRAQYWYRLLFVAPIVVPLVVTLNVWSFIYDPDIGLVKTIFDANGWELQTRMLGDPRYAIFFLVAIGFPWVSGVNVLIFLAGLQAIDQEIRDSAQLDGATGFRRFLYIDLPLLLGQIKLIGILAVINGIQGFHAQFILTRGGPGYATMVPGMWMYIQGYNYYRMGYSSAIGSVMFILILMLSMFILQRFRSPAEYVAD